MKKIYLMGACSALSMSWAAGAYAQQASSEQGDSDASFLEMQEIIVSATRRNEKLQDVPLSVSVFTPEKLNADGIVGYEGLANFTPGVVINKASQNFNNFTARGLATNGYGAGLGATVAIYIDELPISANGNSTILDPNLYDVERVEFLRGPQGTLFGSGSLAGAARILLKQPDLDSFGYSTLVDYGLTGSDSIRQRYNGMINVPLIEDELAFRIVGSYKNEDGYVDNIGTGFENANSLEDWSIRASLLWEPNDALSLKLMINHQDSQPADASLISPHLGKNVRYSTRPDTYAGKLTTYNATLEYQFDGVRLISSSTYGRWDQEFDVDLDDTFYGAIPFLLDATGYDDVFVEEFRLVSDPGGRFDWVLGGFYFDKRRDVDFEYGTTEEFLAVRGMTGLDGVVFQEFATWTDITEYAAFGELTYHVSDKFWLTGGLRYGRSDVQSGTYAGGFSSNYFINSLFFIPGPLTITPGTEDDVPGLKVHEEGLSYKFSASYRASDAMTAYATVSTGFRTPTANARAGSVSTVDPDDLVIPDGATSDDVTNYEVGLKGTWLDGKLTANLAAYLIDWNNIQVQANRTSDSVQFVTNIGGARSKGIEFEIYARPVDGLDLFITGAFNDAKVTRITEEQSAISGAVDGSRLASPHFKGSLNAKYSFDVGDGARGFVAGSIYHVGSFPGSFEFVPGSPGVVNTEYDFTDSYQNVNFQVGYEKENWSLIGYVENAFDDYSITYVHPERFAPSRRATLRPRTVGIRFSYTH